jgi:hypothetical protein
MVVGQKKYVDLAKEDLKLRQPDRDAPARVDD